MRLSNNNVDIFCRVIDNYGDAGFSYRLAHAFKHQSQKSRQVRLFIDEINTLAKILPEMDPSRASQMINGVEIIYFFDREHKNAKRLPYAPLIIESLASSIPEIAKKEIFSYAEIVLNVEHLTAETAFESMHGLSMPGYPVPRYLIAQGFSKNSAGILIEEIITQTIAQASKTKLKLRNELFLPYKKLLPYEPEKIMLGSLFSYSHDFSELLKDLQTLNKPCILFVLGDPSQKSVKEALEIEDIHWLSDNIAKQGSVYFIFEDLIAVTSYDRLLMITDFNMVRGEDSLARAILAGKPFIWHSYDQDDNYQLVKVQAFLDILNQYQNNPVLFKHYTALLLAYNQRPPYLENDKPQENYCQFFNSFATIQPWINNLRQFLIARGGLITEIERFIEKL